jgi:HAD superfamily hydrolase (TIGR01490 family)
MPNLVVFDFDGTITRKDTMLSLARFRYGTIGYLAGMLVLLPWLLGHLLGIYPNHRAKEKFLTLFFGGMEAKDFDHLCEKFAEEELNSLIRQEALTCLLKHKERGDRVLVVTASAANWVSPWCKKYEVECLASTLEISNGKITGKLEGNNCYGEEKVRRLFAVVCPDAYDALLVYGDSRGDEALGKRATQYFYRHFE